MAMVTPLKRAREKREGLEAREVAEAVGCEKSHYSRVERGETTASPALAARIAAYFGHEVTETQILYPERYAAPDEAAA